MVMGAILTMFDPKSVSQTSEILSQGCIIAFSSSGTAASQKKLLKIIIL